MLRNDEQRAILRGSEKQIFDLVFENSTPTQLAECLRVPVENAVRFGDDDLVRKLVKAGASLNVALYSAIQRGSTDLVDELLLRGALDPIVSEKGEEAVHLAARLDHEDILRSLLRKGADKDATNKEELSALQLAANDGCCSAVKVLLEAGANATHRGEDRESALDLAARGAHLDVLRELLEHGVDADDCDSDMWTALHCAVESEKPQAVEVLLEAEADVDFAEGDHEWTRLMQTCNRRPNTRTMQVALALLKGGADTGAIDTEGNSALHIAALHDTSAGSNPELVDLLLRWGADETASNLNGDNPAQRLTGSAQQYGWNLGSDCYVNVLNLLETSSSGQGVASPGLASAVPRIPR